MATKHNYPLHFLKFGLWIAGLSALALLCYRASFVLSFVHANHVVTSGFEEESLFALWKWHHHQPVYSDPHQFPYAASYFNWLFYTLYGSLISLTLSILNLGDEWLPTIGRTYTLILVFLGFCLQYKFISTKFKSISKEINFALCALIWFGPLFGFWAMTLRPDLLALFFETLAIFSFLFIGPKRILSILISGILCYLAWSCKQVSIVTPAVIGSYLLLKRDWRGLILLILTYFSLVAVTLYFASENMLKMVFFQDTAVHLNLSVFIQNISKFIIKSSPIWGIILGLIFTQKFKIIDLIKSSLSAQISVLGIVIWSVLILPLSSKTGAAENYHFIALFYFILLTISLLDKLTFKEYKAPLSFGLLLYLVMMGFGFGHNNVALIQSQKSKYQALKSCMASLPQPIFIYNHYAALPWINPSEQSFVLAYNYASDRRKEPFEYDGIGGLIDNGYFKTVMLPTEYSHFDKSNLTQFKTQTELCEGYKIYILSSFG